MSEHNPRKQQLTAAIVTARLVLIIAVVIVVSIVLGFWL